MEHFSLYTTLFLFCLALPFLNNTEVFLFPIVGICFIYILNFIGYPFGVGWNASRIVAHVYFDS